MKFEDYRISEDIKRAIAELSYKRPTDIQYKAIPSILKGEDVLAIAQTGTGKTAAFAIPALELLLKKKKSKAPRVLIMVPTHELALQTELVFKSIGKYTKLIFFALFGSTDQDPQIRKLKEGIDVLIATPGRLFDLRSQGYLDLTDVDILILDEADHMLDMGFYTDIMDLLKFIPKKRQTLFFSATIDEKIKKLAYSLVKNAIRIQISPDDPISKNITHALAFVAMDDKRFFLERIIKENPEEKILVFVRTKVRAERVLNALERVGIEALTIHSDKTHQERKTTMEAFAKGNRLVLIATDVSARGVDIPSVDRVINYDLPEDPENYVHRIGRTGRGKQKGRALSLVAEGEKGLLDEIEKLIGKSIPVAAVAESEYQETVLFSDQIQMGWKDIQKEILEFETKEVNQGKTRFKLAGKKRKKK